MTCNFIIFQLSGIINEEAEIEGEYLFTFQQKCGNISKTKKFTVRNLIRRIPKDRERERAEE